MSHKPTTPGRVKLPRLYVPQLAAGALELGPDSAHYLRDVLRLPADSRVDLFDGRGAQAAARLVRVDRSGVLLEVDAALNAMQARVELVVGAAAPKGERADWLVEKLSELGVAEVVWLECERAVRLPRGEARRERWLRVAQAAAAQSGNTYTPSFSGPLPLSDLLARPAHTRYLAEAGGVALADLPRPGGSVVLLVGPEGGWTDREVAAALQAGYTRVKLGQHTMRVETAAVVGAGMILAV